MKEIMESPKFYVHEFQFLLSLTNHDNVVVIPSTHVPYSSYISQLICTYRTDSQQITIDINSSLRYLLAHNLNRSKVFINRPLIVHSLMNLPPTSDQHNKDYCCILNPRPLHFPNSACTPDCREHLISVYI